MLLKAFQKGDIDRFEMMALAEEIFNLQKEKEQISSLDDVDFQKEKGFSFIKTFPLSASKSKRILFLKEMKKHLGKRLTSIFLNHLFAVDKKKALLDFLQPVSKPFLVACGGLSGSGKSRVAREMAGFVAPKWGCFIIRDDVVRKQMLSVPLSSNLDDTFYTPENEKKVYSQMRREAKKM